MQISPSLCADCGIGRDHHRTRPGEQEAAADGKRGWRVFPRGEFPLWSSGPKSGSNHPFRPGGRRHSKCGGSAVERTFRCLSRCKSPLCPFLLRRRSAACPPHGAGGRSGLSAIQGVREREVPTGRVSGQSPPPNRQATPNSNRRGTAFKTPDCNRDQTHAVASRRLGDGGSATWNVARRTSR